MFTKKKKYINFGRLYYYESKPIVREGKMQGLDLKFKFTNNHLKFHQICANVPFTKNSMEIGLESYITLTIYLDFPQGQPYSF